MTPLGTQPRVTFTVAGHAEPAGSKRAVPTRADWQRVPGVRWKVLDANVKADGWKKIVNVTASGAMLRKRLRPFEGPLWVEMVFSVPRPASHFRTNGELNAEGLRHPYPAKKPDVLKLARAVEDGMTGAAYVDDAQIVSETIRKQWGLEEVVHVTVMPL